MQVNPMPDIAIYSNRYRQQFCSHPCTDPEKVAAEMDLPPKSPPKREPPRQLPGYPDSNLKVSRPKHIQEDDALYEAWRGTYASKIAAVRLRGSTGGIIDKSRDEKKELKKRAALEAKVRANNIVDYLGPPYSINNDWPNGISDKAVDTDVGSSN